MVINKKDKAFIMSIRRDYVVNKIIVFAEDVKNAIIKTKKEFPDQEILEGEQIRFYK